MIELAIQTPDHIPHICILLDVVDVGIPALIGLDVLDDHCLKAGNISNRHWNRAIIFDDPLQIVDKWWISLICDQHNLYVHLHVPVSTFYTTQ